MLNKILDLGIHPLVDACDETGETLAITTILTMVKKRNQD